MSPPLAFYEALIDALVAVPPPELSAEEHHRAIAASALFASEQVNALSAELRWSLKIGLAGFQGLVRFSHRRAFSRLPLAQRRRIVAAWAFGPVSLARQLFRPIRTTALVAYYEAVANSSRES